MDSKRGEREPFRLVFVCTGNTCRSPMAEALARRALDRRGWDHVAVASAGVAADAGSPASDGAVAAAERVGLDLSDHRSAPLAKEVLESADLILAMTPGHLMVMVEAGAGDRAALLTVFAAGSDDADVPDSVLDPFGGPVEVYDATLELLERLVEGALDRLEPVLSP